MVPFCFGSGQKAQEVAMGWRLLVTSLLEREDGRRRVRAVSPAFRRKGQLRRQPPG